MCDASPITQILSGEFQELKTAERETTPRNSSRRESLNESSGSLDLEKSFHPRFDFSVRVLVSTNNLCQVLFVLLHIQKRINMQILNSFIFFWQSVLDEDFILELFDSDIQWSVLIWHLFICRMFWRIWRLQRVRRVNRGNLERGSPVWCVTSKWKKRN